MRTWRLRGLYAATRGPCQDESDRVAARAGAGGAPEEIAAGLRPLDSWLARRGVCRALSQYLSGEGEQACAMAPQDIADHTSAMVPLQS